MQLLAVGSMSYLYFSVSVVCIGIHKVKNKELHRLTEVPALQCGEVQKHMDRYLKDIKDKHNVSEVREWTVW